MKDEPLDIIPFILLLGIVIAISMNIMIPLYRDASMLKYDVNYDKTVSAIEGEMYYNNSEVSEGFDYHEMVLLLGRQTYFMPMPRAIDIGGTVVAIQPDTTDVVKPGEGYTEPDAEMYIPDNSNTSALVRQKLYDWCTAFTAKTGKNGFDLLFDIKFTTNEKEEASDDCYTVCVVAKDSEYGNLLKLRCLPGGNLESTNSPYDLVYKK